MISSYIGGHQLVKGGLMSKDIRGNNSHLTLSDRITIEQYILQKATFRDIAKVLHKDPSTISKEILRNRHKEHDSFFHHYCDICIHRYTDCEMRHVCGYMQCNRSCKYCNQRKVPSLCRNFKVLDCSLKNHAPYVCNSCKIVKSCHAECFTYSAVKAQRKYQHTLSSSRKGIDLTMEELQKLNALISPLVLQGQPLSHIFASHKDEIPCCRRTLYNYFDQGIFKAKNIDLPRRVKYKKRKPIKKPLDRNHQQVYRGRRTYKDFLFFMENHPDMEVVEMDTVMGSNKKGKCILTLLFRNSNFMLCILLPRCNQESVIMAINDLCDSISLRCFKKAFPVILTDNGSEFKNPWDIEKDQNGKNRTYVFYCDPYESNQKGKLEKNHEFIRYIIPKGRSMQGFTQADISLMTSHINSVARDSLNGQTPFDLAELLLDKRIPASLDLHKISPDQVILKPALLKK